MLTIKRCKLFYKTKEDILDKDAELYASYLAFVELKKNDPRARYGTNDKPSTGIYKKLIPKIWHAHLSHRISIWYRIVGNVMCLYGTFSHDDTGTGPGKSRKPAKIKQVAKTMARQQFEQQEKFAAQLKEADEGEWVALTEEDFRDMEKGNSIVDVLEKYFKE